MVNIIVSTETLIFSDVSLTHDSDSLTNLTY